LVKKVNMIVGGIIEEHKSRRASGFVPDESTGDFVDVLLDLEGEDKLSDTDMIAVLWVSSFHTCRLILNYTYHSCMILRGVCSDMRYLS
jgi:hypothetical protein